MTYAFNLSQFANNVNSSGKAILTSGQAVTGILPVANGGSGASTLSANAVLVGNGTSAINTVAPSTSGNVLTSNGTAWTSAAPTFNTISNVLSTSGTQVEFLSIPSAATQITISLSNVSITGTDAIDILLGTSSAYATTGYNAARMGVAESSTSQTAYTTQIRLTGALSASTIVYGSIVFTKVDATTNTWVGSGCIGGPAEGLFIAATIALSGALNKIKVKTSGTNTFDAGVIGICYSK